MECVPHTYLHLIEGKVSIMNNNNKRKISLYALVDKARSPTITCYGTLKLYVSLNKE
jgi:aspartate 1-decarboxylase